MCNIFDNHSLSLSLLLKFGFDYYTSKAGKKCLKFTGVAVFIANRGAVEMMVRQKKIRFGLMQCVFRACFRTDKDTREILDTDTPSMGVFLSTKYIYNGNNTYTGTNGDDLKKLVWQNPAKSDKIQAASEAKEMCNLKYIDDSWSATLFVQDKCVDKITIITLSVFNNNGLLFDGIDWHTMDIGKLISDVYEYCIPMLCYEKDKLQMSDVLENVLKSLEKKKHRIDFCKKWIYFLNLSVMRILDNNEIHDHNQLQGSNNVHRYRRGRYHLLSLLSKHESLLENVSRYYLTYIVARLTNENQVKDYIEKTVKPKVMRLKRSIAKCKQIKNNYNILSKNAKDKHIEYSWRCLVCGKLNEYTKYNMYCPNCARNDKTNRLKIWVDEYKFCLFSLSPLFCMESDLNKSKTFCVDPCENSFYIIRDLSFRNNDCGDEKSIINKYSYRYLEKIVANKNNLKSRLSQIIFHCGRFNTIGALFIVLFDKVKPLTLYQLKHILFEIVLAIKFGFDSAKYWKFVDVVGNQGYDVFNNLNDDSTIDIKEPWYIDSTQIFFDMKLRRNMYKLFGKTKFDQRLYHQYLDYNININYNFNKRYKPLKANSVKEVLAIDSDRQFEHSPSLALHRHTHFEIEKFFNNRQSSDPLLLVGLVKEVIKNNCDEDLLPTQWMNTQTKNSIKAKIDIIDHIIDNYQMKTQTSISTPQTIFGKFNKFTMGLVKELSTVYTILDTLQSKMDCQRHKSMGYPLNWVAMLSLILYCRYKCNHNLCLSQRSHQVMKKWPYFHCILNYAIVALSQFEIHYEHMYTGICGVFFQSNNEAKQVFFQTNVSFSTDLNVALEFRGDSGMVIGLNVKRILNIPLPATGFICCDVSWMSANTEEKEILCSVGSSLTIYPNLVRKRGNTQWIACVEDELDNKKVFQSLFGSLADID